MYIQPQLYGMIGMILMQLIIVVIDSHGFHTQNLSLLIMYVMVCWIFAHYPSIILFASIVLKVDNPNTLPIRM